MTIAPLPTPAGAAVPAGSVGPAGTGSVGPAGTGSVGSCSAGSTSAGSSDSTASSADVFATLVQALLGARAGGDGDTPAAAPGTAEDAPSALSGDGSSPTGPGDLATHGTTGGSGATAGGGADSAAAATALDPGAAAALSGAVVGAVPLPLAPALVAGLGLARLTAPPASGVSATVSATATDDHAPLPTTATPSGEPATEPATASVDHAPLPATATAGGEPATEPATATVDHTPLPTTATPSGEPATEPATATVDHAPLTPRPTSEPTPGRRTDETAADAGRHTDATSADAGRMTSPSDASETRTANAPGPSLVQTTQSTQAAPGVEATQATTRAAEPQPTTQVTRSVAAQVVPELTRLVQAGPGTHRMVLRLDPEHLGEVRITLTVHPAGVRVRMATGSEDARAVLSDGLAELQRALGAAAGRPAGETQVAVLHQPAGQQSPQGQGTAYDGGAPSTQTDAGPASDHQTPGGRPQAGDRDAGRPARTQVDTTARDGSQGAGTPRPADPPTSYRGTSPRLDVSM